MALPNLFSFNQSQRPQCVKATGRQRPQGIKGHGASKAKGRQSATGHQMPRGVKVPQGVKGYGASKAKESEVWATKGHRASKTTGHQRLRGVKGHGASKCHRASKAMGHQRPRGVIKSQRSGPEKAGLQGHFNGGLRRQRTWIPITKPFSFQPKSKAKGLQRPWVVIKSQRSGPQKAGLQGHFDGGLRRQRTWIPNWLLIQGVSYWNGHYELALTDKDMQVRWFWPQQPLKNRVNSIYFSSLFYYKYVLLLLINCCL